ncbi:fructose-specific PTS transporter subunit EIIC [Sporolactobacillus sp. KGMB 08714]|uniref:fructose-specific PTS transporter subunit EIIC n=1 Tax=Sporolactobacillus sp. KGMB 08714 TaxID=3064704 RepID=UPI002FBEA467
MNLQHMTDRSLIVFSDSWTTKKEILDGLINQFVKGGYVTDRDSYKQSVLEREKISATGLENGFAIPHGKSAGVVKAGFAIARLAKPLPADAWASIRSDNQVELIFLLAIPDKQAGTTHLKLLQQLSTKLMNEDFVNQLKTARNPDELFNSLNLDEADSKDNRLTCSHGKNLIAVTACATGIAHTYMAAEALKKSAKKMGVSLIVEKQGANGLEDSPTPEQIKNADGVLFAVDTKIKGLNRFNGKPYIEVNVAEPLKNGEALIDRALNHPQGILRKQIENDSDTLLTSKEITKGFSWKRWGTELGKAVMTGISYMIPVMVAAGIMLGIAKLTWLYIMHLPIADIDLPKYNSFGGFAQLIHYLDLFGGMTLNFMYPIFAMFVAYAIADRVGLISGFLGGIFAAGLNYTLWGITTGLPSGFLGALVFGLAAGYIARFLNTKIHLSKNLQAMKPMLIIPGISVLAIFLLNIYIVSPVFGGLNLLISDWIKSMANGGKIGLSSIIAAATAFDLGGPVNKAAGAVAIGLAADKIFPLTPRVLAIVIPPIGMGISTLIDKWVVGRHVYPADLRVAGNTSFLLGFLAISEGAIPFMLRNPLITVPLNIIGAIAGSVTAVMLGAVQWLPLPAIWGWPLVSNLPAYLIGLFVGVLIIALCNIFIRYHLIKKKEAQGEKIDY